MAKSEAKPTTASRKTRFEFRVWGEHEKAWRTLSKLATEETSEKFDDCYFLSDDPSYNAKVRDASLKVKELVDTRKGFECWESTWHESASDAPAPFDDLFDDLRLDKPAQGKKYDFSKAVRKLADDAPRAVFVSKRRRRYRVGGIRAESTEIRIKGTCERLHTLAIEGDDLESLVALRKELGLKKQDNVPVHRAIEAEL